MKKKRKRKKVEHKKGEQRKMLTCLKKLSIEVETIQAKKNFWATKGRFHQNAD